MSNVEALKEGEKGFAKLVAILNALKQFADNPENKKLFEQMIMQEISVEEFGKKVRNIGLELNRAYERLLKKEVKKPWTSEYKTFLDFADTLAQLDMYRTWEEPAAKIKERINYLNWVFEVHGLGSTNCTYYSKEQY